MTADLQQNSFYTMVTGEAEQKAPSFEKNEDESGDEVQMLSNEDVQALSDESTSSEMPHEARRILVHLMRQGTVLAAQKPKMFELLCRYEQPIRRHLSEVYLQLVLDQKAGVAFVATADSEHCPPEEEASLAEDEGDEEIVSLISKRPLSLFDTLILLVLRKHYQDRETAGEQKITIDIERLESYLTPFLPITDHASKDRKRLLARVNEMKKRKILSTLRGEEYRYEVTPIIRYVVSANMLEQLLEAYTAMSVSSTGETSRKTRLQEEH